MPTIYCETTVAASPEICFDLALDVDAHLASTQKSNERAVAGVTHGQLKLGDEVTWEGKHLGVRQRLTSLIVEYDRPRRFVDHMVKGAFAELSHEHVFSGGPEQTVITDTMTFRSPLGILGKIADALVIKRYMTKLLVERNQFLKESAEGQASQK